MQIEIDRDPHQTLGLHEVEGGKVIRLWCPGSSQAFFSLRGDAIEADQVDKRGLFEALVDESVTWKDYQVTHPSGLVAHDPYAFLPTFSREDEKRFSTGKHETIYDVMGGRLAVHMESRGVKFSAWAPCAKSVSLVGDFNNWNVMLHPMRLMGDSGVWELFVPGLDEGEKYKFYVTSQEGAHHYKADPYALQGEMRPQTASVITRNDLHKWKDEVWIENRKKRNHLKSPINIYEIHLGSWKREGDDFQSYRTLAPQIAAYCKEMGYTHVEFMPVMGHPLDESWGYQVTGFYAISRRYGTIEDFQYLVDTMHQNEIGVLFDWVPGHFPRDEHSIAQFDGTYLYEHRDPRQGYHPDWNTHIFNYGRYEVANFLLGSALYYLEKMHIDGFRVDAVSSMVHLDYGRKKGEWIPNEKGGNENFEAVTFLQNLNRTIHQKYPGVLMIAEESHAFPKVTTPVSRGGLGFDLKWNLGWMHDTLGYFGSKFSERSLKQNILSHEFTYLYDENHVLPLSHDEVVHEKKSLLSKMPGNEWEKFANLRLLLSYMICHPGKKLLFMGGEFGQWNEWDCGEPLHFVLTNLPFHKKLQACVRDLNHFYLKHGALWERDFNQDALEWVDTTEVFSYLRHSEKETLLCVHNFSGTHLENYLLPYPHCACEIMNTDSQEYGGYGIINEKIKSDARGTRLNLAPFSTSIYETTSRRISESSLRD